MRPGGPDDVEAVLSMWDRAITWLVARGQLGQWGSEPVSARPAAVDRVREWSRAPGLTVAEIGRSPVGASVIAETCPPYVTSVELPETYLAFLISDRDWAGQGIGSELVRQAARDARARDSKLLRVDCWAGAPSLVGWYERQGFTRTTTFEVNDGWRGQVFEMPLSDQ
jgi:ribosomal protein S18 acetylase RimI-like enzyme